MTPRKTDTMSFFPIVRSKICLSSWLPIFWSELNSRSLTRIPLEPNLDPGSAVKRCRTVNRRRKDGAGACRPQYWGF